MNIDEAVKLIPQRIAEQQYDEAQKLCHEVLAESPKNFEALRWLGHIGMLAKQYAPAAQILEMAVKSNPADVDARIELGKALGEIKEYDRAIEHLRAALAIVPDDVPTLNETAFLLAAQERFNEAGSLLRQVAKLQPDSVDAHLNLASIQYRAARPAAAIRSFERAVEIDPQNLEAHIGLSNALLLTGDLQRGLAHFEHRWKMHGRDYPKHDSPAWDGKPAPGKTLLLVSEQGLGDTIQFARYLPRLAAMGMKVTLAAAPSLIEFLRTANSEAQIVSSHDPFPDAAFHLPLLSLPLVLRDTLESIPRETPYLRADANRVVTWRERIAKDVLNIGLVWSGNPEHINDANRSIAASKLAPLASVERVQYHWILPTPIPADAPRELKLADQSELLKDFADTAALVENLDLVITVDTAAAHVAGALGKRVWIMLPFVPDWRWMMERSETPWYPTAKLFRQPRTGDWDSVISRVAETLRVKGVT